jgi:hypothetical protein
VKPQFEVRARKEMGAPYTRHALYVGGNEIHAQLSPYSEAEIAERVRTYLYPQAVPEVRDVRGKAGRPSKKQTVNERGFLWEIT